MNDTLNADGFNIETWTQLVYLISLLNRPSQNQSWTELENICFLGNQLAYWSIPSSHNKLIS